MERERLFEIEKGKRQRRKRSKKSKEKILALKRAKSLVKQNRKVIRSQDVDKYV